MTQYSIPKQNEPLVYANGLASVHWYNFWRTTLSAQSGQELQDQIDAILAQLAEIVGADFTISGNQSVAVSGSPQAGAVGLSLVGDVTDPGNSYYYGTDAAGDKGFWALRLDALQDVDTSGAVVGDTLIFDGSEWVAGEIDVPFNRITADGDARLTANDDLRICY